MLLELLRVVRSLQNEGIELVICGGWVPFLKQLARESETAHSISMDIDLLFRQTSRERHVVDRIRTLLVGEMDFEPSRTHTFRYEKRVEGNIVQLDLPADFSRSGNDDPVRRIQGMDSSLDMCLVDGAEDLAAHVETIRISWLVGDKTEVCEITIPDPVGFLMLKQKFAAIVRRSRIPTTSTTIVDTPKSRTRFGKSSKLQWKSRPCDERSLLCGNGSNTRTANGWISYLIT